MQSGKTVQASPSIEGTAADRQRGLYVYCIADGGQEVRLGPIGIDGREVYSVPYREVCAVAHDCPAQPYQSTELQTVEGWVMAHQRVVDAAWERWGTVLPLAFDTVVQGRGDGGPREGVGDWLAGEYENLKRKLEAVRGKAEYGVQLFWEPRTVARDIAAKSEEIRRLEEEIRSKPRGLAYMYRQRLENILKREMEAKADRCSKDFYHLVKKHICDLKVEKAKRADDDRQMIMNLSCLVYRDKVSDLGEALVSIAEMEGFSVRFTGPWPPYSFVSG